MNTEKMQNLCCLQIRILVVVYFGLTTGSFVLNILKGLLFFYVCIHAAQVLHNRMFAAVLRAPVRFFDTNPIGTHILSVACTRNIILAMFVVWISRQ